MEEPLCYVHKSDHLNQTTLLTVSTFPLSLEATIYFNRTGERVTAAAAASVVREEQERGRQRTLQSV